MEVSTKSGTNIQLTDEAKIVFRNLVRLDGVQKLQKEVIV